MSLKERSRTSRSVEAQFKDALFAFSDDPTPSNLARYLEASRALPKRPRARRAPRPRVGAARISSDASPVHS
jgi:hypothetical protein